MVATPTALADVRRAGTEVGRPLFGYFTCGWADVALRTANVHQARKHDELAGGSCRPRRCLRRGNSGLLYLAAVAGERAGIAGGMAA